MLQPISTKAFIEGIIILTAIYYALVAALCYPKEIRNRIRKRLLKRVDDSPDDEVLNMKDKV